MDLNKALQGIITERNSTASDHFLFLFSVQIKVHSVSVSQCIEYNLFQRDTLSQIIYSGGKPTVCIIYV